ncbi:RNA methyltransferase [Desulfobacter latus]|uniref:RNA methyltransferase n=1 Tax=Desulfobacter latus TaxID=2292 RepID=A0A850T7I6_9BACT|nr:RNA methyltransferase [Desulfobacter latus]NWH04197.1 RNA methyltransferase [Desulfobacter latus]
MNAPLYLALIHYPVVNKNGHITGSALTNMDLHDIARAGRTFGVKAYYVVTPYTDQKKLASQIMDHWTHGHGGTVNPARKSAIERIRVADTFEAVCNDIENEQGPGQAVVKVATSATPPGPTRSCRTLGQELKGNAPHVIVFGTAWGLAPEVINQCDHILEPIQGAGSYNHLSVRSAASIYLDRLING